MPTKSTVVSTSFLTVSDESDVDDVSSVVLSATSTPKAEVRCSDSLGPLGFCDLPTWNALGRWRSSLS